MTTLGLLISKRNALPTTVNGVLGTFLSAFLGEVPGQATQAHPNRPFKVPNIIAQILGKPQAKTYIDILTSVIGVQKFDGDTYVPNGLSHKTAQIQKNQAISIPKVWFTPTPLLGWNNPMVAPFNNVPIWAILKQHSVPVANEMYTTLRVDMNGNITPHFFARQIPFNTEEFVQKHPDNTKFRELPRWRVSVPLITSYSTGKSNSLRVNYVQVQATGGFDSPEIQALIRSQVTPRWDTSDIERNGLFSYITQVQATYTLSAIDAAQKWTDMVTDRMIGSHLKLSGSMKLVGVQEPICVGDNLEYEGLLYHIEEIEHKLVVNPATGAKSFSTSLAISNGVPASGPVLPEIAVRRFETKVYKPKDIDLVIKEKAEDGTTTQTKRIKRKGVQSAQTLTGVHDPVKHSDAPATNFETDKD